MYPMFIVALFTIARTWKQPKCPSTDEWIKKMWYIYIMEYYSAIKRDEIGSFVKMWMNLESVIQSEVSQEEKNKYSILTQVCGIQKNGTDEPICRGRNRDTDVENGHVDTEGEGEGGMNWEIRFDLNNTIMCQIASGNLLYNTGSSAQCSVMTQMGGMGGRSKREAIYVYIQLIHLIVQQKLTQYCKEIIL